MAIDQVDLTQLKFYYSAVRDKFTTSAEPTLEGTTGTDSINRAVADGGQVPDVVDGSRQGLLTALVSTGLVTGDDSTFASAGNWDVSDANVSIAGGLLVFNVVAVGDGAVLSTKVQANVSYFLTYQTLNADAGGVRANLGGTLGNVRTTPATSSEIITAGSSNNDLKFQATANNTEIDMDSVTLIPLDFRFDMPMDERIDVDTLIVDNNSLRQAYGSDERKAVALHHHTSDAFGSATQLTPTGGYARVLGQEFGYLDFAGYQSSPTDNVKINDTAAIQNIFDGGGTIAGWIYVRSDGEANVGGIVNKEAGNKGWTLRVEGESSGLVDLHFGHLFSSDDGEWEAQALLTINAWHHVAATYDNGSTSNNPLIYIDGVSQTVTEIFAPTGTRDSDVGADLYIGTNFIDSSTFDGLIAQIQLWTTIESAAEILALFNGTEPSNTRQAEFLPSGLRPTTGEWIDTTAQLSGAVTVAEFKRTPDANTNGVIINTYTSVNARYWYVTVNDEQDTAINTDLEIGEIMLAKSFSPSVNPTVGLSEVQDYSGIDVVQKYGGGSDLNERHGRRRIWTFTWDYLTNDDKASFQLMLEQTKKRILYFTLNNDAAFPVLYCGRILEAVEINTLVFQAYGLSITIIEEI